jgi:RNA polymerase sigma factor (sigma-70 family)
MADPGHEVPEALELAQPLMRLAYLLCSGNVQPAEDLVQTVLARLLERGTNGLTSPLAYARRAVINEHHSTHRRAELHRRTMVRIARAQEPASLEGLEDHLVMLGALRMLNVRERTAIVLRYYEQWDDQEIAEALGCSRATVRSLVYRALPKLRVALGQPATTPQPARRKG